MRTLHRKVKLKKNIHSLKKGVIPSFGHRKFLIFLGFSDVRFSLLMRIHEAQGP